MIAQELRIGNLYYYQMVDNLDERERWLEPSVIDTDDLICLNNIPDDPDFLPIILTKSILQSAGFTWSDFHKGMLYGHYLIKKKKKVWHVYHHLNQLTVLAFLHQLQNFWYAIHQEELPLAEPIPSIPLKK